MKKKTIVVHLVSLCALCIEFILYRYVFFEIHGMYDWPFTLFLFGSIIIGISFFTKTKLVSIFTSIAYIVGFIAGVIFQTNGIDPGGGKTNSLWIIWTTVFVCAIISSVINEIIIIVKIRKR